MCEKGQSSNGEISDCELGKKGSSNEAVSTTQKVKTYQRGEKKLRLASVSFLALSCHFSHVSKGLWELPQNRIFFCGKTQDYCRPQAKNFASRILQTLLININDLGKTVFKNHIFTFFCGRVTTKFVASPSCIEKTIGHENQCTVISFVKLTF